MGIVAMMRHTGRIGDSAVVSWPGVAGFRSFVAGDKDALVTETVTQQPLVILGMHRCGTSAAAGIATLLGATPPGLMLPPAEDNPFGFWEPTAVVRANQALLTSNGYNWFDCLPFDMRQMDEPARQAALPFIRNILRDTFGSAPFFVIKDPRMSLLFDVWRPALEGAAILIMIRHPAEVAGSLLRRDECPPEVSFPLWLHYILEAEYQSRGLKRAVVSYDRFLLDWRAAMSHAAAQAGFVWPHPPASVTEDASRAVQAKLRHHFASPGRVEVGAPPLRQWMAQTWSVLRECEASGFDAIRLRALDDIRSAFGRWRATSAPRVSAKPRAI
jgi:hypothetical protein